MPDFMKLMAGNGAATLPDQLDTLIAEVRALGDATRALKAQSTPAVLTDEAVWDFVNGDARARGSLRAHTLIVGATKNGLYGLKIGNATQIWFYLAAYVTQTIPLGQKGFAIGRGQTVAIDLSQSSGATAQGSLIVTVEPGYDVETQDYA